VTFLAVLLRASAPRVRRKTHFVNKAITSKIFQNFNLSRRKIYLTRKMK
jgi:hypothetical protein